VNESFIYLLPVLRAKAPSCGRGVFLHVPQGAYYRNDVWHRD